MFEGTSQRKHLMADEHEVYFCCCRSLRRSLSSFISFGRSENHAHIRQSTPRWRCNSRTVVTWATDWTISSKLENISVFFLDYNIRSSMENIYQYGNIQLQSLSRPTPYCEHYLSILRVDCYQGGSLPCMSARRTAVLRSYFGAIFTVTRLKSNVRPSSNLFSGWKTSSL